MAVILLVMLTGCSPFADPEAPHDQIRLFNVSELPESFEVAVLWDAVRVCMCSTRAQRGQRFEFAVNILYRT